MVAGFENIDHGGVGLGLGGEVGTGGSFELFARARLTLVGGGDAGQRGGTEVDHVGGVDAQAERFQQLWIVADVVRVGLQEVAHHARVDQFRRLRPDLAHASSPLEDRLVRPLPVAHELIKPLFG